MRKKKWVIIILCIIIVSVVGKTIYNKEKKVQYKKRDTNNYQYLLQENKAEKPRKIKCAKKYSDIKRKYQSISYTDKCREQLGYNEGYFCYEHHMVDYNKLEHKDDGGYAYASDGQYIYSPNMHGAKSTIDISKVSNNHIEYIDCIDLKKDKYVGNYEVTFDEVKIIDDKLIIEFEHGFETGIFIYNISNRENPKLLSKLYQVGHYGKTIINNNKIYVISYTYDEGLNDSLDNKVTLEINHKPIKYTDIYLPEDVRNNQYTVITAIDLNNCKEFISAKAVMGIRPNIVYFKDNDLYLIDEVYRLCNTTKICKLKLDENKIEAVNSIIIQGHCSDESWMENYNEFYVDDYNVNLIVATNTGSNSGYCIYSFDSKLNITNKIEGQILKETIKPRFIKNKLFLFGKKSNKISVVNLDTMKEEECTSNLKYPKYMKSIDENHILGINDENKYLELNIYDTSNNEYKMISSLKLKEYVKFESYYSCILGNIDPSKKVVSIPCFDKDNKKYSLLLSCNNYDLKVLIKNNQSILWHDDFYSIVVGDYWYVYSNLGERLYDINTKESINNIVIRG